MNTTMAALHFRARHPVAKLHYLARNVTKLFVPGNIDIVVHDHVVAHRVNEAAACRYSGAVANDRSDGPVRIAQDVAHVRMWQSVSS